MEAEDMIQYCKTTDEFLLKYEKDVKNIILAKYRNILRHDKTVDDVCQNFSIHMLRNRAVEKFDVNHPSKVKFSTYCYKCLHNYLLAYELDNTYAKKQQYREALSLDAKLNPDSEFSFTGHDVMEDVVDSIVDSEFEHDSNVIYLELQKIDSVKTNPTIPLSEMFKSYLEGDRDRDLAIRYNLSNAAVGARKRHLREVLISKYGEDIRL